MPQQIPESITAEEDASMAGSHLSGLSALSGASRASAYYAGSVPPSPGQFPFATAANQFSSDATVTSIDSSDISLKRDREREGRCSECGMQTHEFRIDPMSNRTRKYPLSVENEVHRGRCLLCHPIQARAVPMTWERTGDAGSVAGSVNTVSTHGNSTINSRRSGGFAPDQVESYGGSSSCSVSFSGRDQAIQEAIHLFQSESADLCDVMAAMRRFPNEPTIQAKGCEKLWIQSWDDETSAAIGRVGGIATILQAMTTFAQDQRLQQCGCEALQNLALNDYNRDVICENGGILTIVRAMETHENVVGVQQCGCTALANLAVNTGNHLEIANTGGVHVIVKAAQRYCDEENVMRAAYQALRALGYNPNQGASQEEQGQQEQQGQQQQHQQQQEQPDRSESSSRGSSRERGVIRLDQHGFPIPN